MNVAVRSTDSVAADLDAMHQRIAARAEQLHDRHGAGDRPIDEWLAAERELVWRAPIEVHLTDGAYVVEAAIAGVKPRQIEIRVASSDVLITADVHHQHPHTGDTLVCEFSPAPLFRAYHFAQPVDAKRATADYVNGLLRITLPITRDARR
jgi:HSP20 family molecular chaperone IbpA